MNDPAAGARSGYAASQGMKRTGKAKIGQGKAIKGKAAKLDKAVLIHFLSFLLCGCLLGLTVFIPFYQVEDLSVLKVLFASFFLVGFLLGEWNKIRMARRIAWAESAEFWPRFLVTLLAFTAVFLGLLIVFFFLPKLLPAFTSQTTFALSALLASATVSLVMPFLIREVFENGLNIEPKKYRIWEFPQNYIEKQPTWNHERLVYANLSFRRKENENHVTTIKAKLPKEANLGELVYLFIRDYNDNKSPEAPIRQLTQSEGTYGWLFRKYSTNYKGIRKLWSNESMFLDPDLSIEENTVEEDCHIYFERIQKPDSHV